MVDRKIGRTIVCRDCGQEFEERNLEEFPPEDRADKDGRCFWCGDRRMVERLASAVLRSGPPMDPTR